MTKKAKATFDVKKKLMGAVAMLLVATIMMVSATYAWFTLSTAPEVKGITTTVGANGSLEIALRTSNTTRPTTGTGDSMDVQDTKDANKTWGNLVDLSAGYGLDEITLKPAKLNVDTGVVSEASILLAPSYGVDGRIANVTQDTKAASRNTNGVFAGTDLGVRAIGTYTNAPENQTIYNAAASNMRSKYSLAQRNARSMLATAGGNAATLVVKRAMSSSATYDIADVNKLESVSTDVRAAVNSADAALLAAIQAYVVSAQSGLTLEEATQFLADNADKTTSDAMLTAAAAANITMDASFATTNQKIKAMLTSLDTADTKIASVKQEVQDSATGEIAWGGGNDTGFARGLNALVTRSEVYINGNPSSEYSAANAGALLGGISIAFVKGSGVISDLAEVVGVYTTSTTIEVSGTATPTTMKATANTGEQEFPAEGSARTYTPDLTTINAIPTGPIGGSSGGNLGEDYTVDEPYGYVLDFWVRTNASGSTLRLEPEETQRVYNGDNASTNTYTLGGGSYMTFKTSAGFDETKVKTLMNCIRVVFTKTTVANDVTTTEVIAYARPNTNGVAADENNDVKAPLALYDSTDANLAFLTGDTMYDLIALDQSVPTMISAIVYLDGEKVDNSMVKNENVSLDGSLNLQFSSSANLTPMENAYRDYTPPTETETEPQQNPEPVNPEP